MNPPDHYKSMRIQPAEFIHANGIPFLEGCVIKYACRHKGKDGAKDIRKAIYCLEMVLKWEYNEAPSPAPTPSSQPEDPTKRKTVDALCERCGTVHRFMNPLTLDQQSCRAATKPTGPPISCGGKLNPIPNT